MGTPGAPMPALLKSTSSRPKVSLVLAKSARTDSGWPTSVGTTSIPVPDAVCSSCAARRPARTTRYPAAHKARLAARPIPLPAPVTRATLALSMSAGGAAQRGHAGGHIGRHRQDTAQAREVEHFTHAGLRAHQDESPIRELGHGGIHGDDKSDPGGTNGDDLAEIDQHFPAGEPLYFVQLAAQVLRIGAGGDATLTPHDANVVDLIQFDEHGDSPEAGDSGIVLHWMACLSAS